MLQPLSVFRLLGWYPEDGVFGDGAIVLPTRYQVYDGAVWVNDQVYSVVTPTANYTGELSYGEAFTASSTRWVVRYGVNEAVGYYCPNGSGMITTIVMIPGNAAINGLNGMPVDIPGSVSNQIGIPNPNTNSGLPFENAISSARATSGIHPNAFDPYLPTGQVNRPIPLYPPKSYL